MIDRSLIGRESPPFTVPVEFSKIHEFARAVRDDNPIYHDADAAGAAGWSAVPAPPTFIQTAAFWAPTEASLMRLLGFDRRYVLHGEQEYSYHRPLVAGDVLTGVQRIVDLQEKLGKRGGTMRIATLETAYTDAAGQLVLTVRSTTIETSPPPGAPTDSQPITRSTWTGGA